MKRTLLILSIMLSLTSAYAAATQHHKGQPLDQIVAIINDDVITRSELNRNLELARIQLAQEHASFPASFEKQVLDKLINKKLQLQIAKQAGMSVADKDLNLAIDNIAKQNQMTAAELFERLNQDGMTTAEYKNELRDQMIIQKLQQQEVVNRITITDDEVKNFLRSKKWMTEGPKEYHVEDILIPMSENPSSDEKSLTEKRAAAVIAALQKGQAYTSIAQTNADFHLQENDLGWRKTDEIPGIFVDEITHMQAKGISKPIEAPNGLHVLRLLEERSISAKQPSPDRKQLEELLLQRKFEQAMQTWVSKLRSQAFIVTNPND